MLTFIIGGARSGKSRFAQTLCPPDARVTYIATARIEDDEMRARVLCHRAERPPGWRTIEEPVALAEAVRHASSDAEYILVDCLTVWLGNFCWEQRQQRAAQTERMALAEIDAIATAAGRLLLIVVSNEVGGGIVPDNAVGRSFRDLQGLVNQRAAAVADQVYLTVAGIPLRIKPVFQPELLK